MPFWPFRLGPFEILILLPLLSIYFIPTIIAAIRQAKNLVGIIMLNIFAGWTFVGWVVSLVWAIVAEKKISPPKGGENSSPNPTTP